MHTLLTPTVVAPSLHGNHWRGEPVEDFSGRAEDIVPHLPSFDRVPFGTNVRRDMIVRRAERRGDIPVPIEAVSKRYTLVQHTDVLATLLQALERAKLNPADVRYRLKITTSGSRMLLRARLPREVAYAAPDGHAMALTFDCFNSVDGSVPLFAVMGWLRFVCGNGLAIGTVHARARRFHTSGLDVAHLAPILSAGLEAAKSDRERLTALARAKVQTAALREWVDGPVARTWGPFAATRVYWIVTTGFDGTPRPRPRRVAPHGRVIDDPRAVPGQNAGASDRYAIAQALAWVARQRREIGESLRFRNQIEELMAQL
ncbi:MAG TPA: DUF932 domain-containing protein [Vicinamibacterales bacterium]